MTQPGAIPARSSRAGRNLPMAIAVGLFLGAIVVALLVFYRLGFVIFIAVATTVAVWEMRGTLMRARGISLAAVPLAAGVAATVITTWWWGHTAQIIGVAATALAIMFYRLNRGAAGYVADMTASIFLAVYLGGLASFATLLSAPDDGMGRMLVFLIAVVCSDTGGYATGVLFGKHPMAPRISPKKSWEGFVGSIVTATVGGSIAMYLLLSAAWWHGAIVGAILAVVATAGDLTESVFKRDLGVKDMGSVLPGHGGIMDRLDSLLPGAFVAYLLLALLVPVPSV